MTAVVPDNDLVGGGEVPDQIFPEEGADSDAVTTDECWTTALTGTSPEEFESVAGGNEALLGGWKHLWAGAFPAKTGIISQLNECSV